MQEQTFPSGNLYNEAFPGLDQAIDKMLHTWQVPGLALAIVKDDQLLCAKGYGLRAIDSAEPVTAETLFGVASVTKTFTAAAVGLLVDAGRVQWDDPVIKHLPDFALYDPYATREITIRDLLCARSGLDGGDFMRLDNHCDRDEVMHRLRYLKPAYGFRTRQGAYTFMYLVAGQLVAAVTGQSWDDFVRGRLLAPLSMQASCTSLAQALQQENRATPYRWIEGQLVPMPWYGLDNVGPAGALATNVIDLAAWISLQLGHGCSHGQQVLSRATLDEIHTPHMIIQPAMAKSFSLDAHLVTYGLGWFLYDHRGHQVVECGGASMDGMTALIAFLPAERLGIVVLANAEQARSLAHALKFLIFDHYLHAPERDWQTIYLARWQQQTAGWEERLKQASSELIERRIPGTQPALALVAYAGTYEDAYYGKIHIVYENDSLLLRYGSILHAQLEHYHYNTFRVKWARPLQGEDMATFTLDQWGQVKQMELTSFAVFRRI